MFEVWFMNADGVGVFEAHASTSEALALGLRTLEEDGYVVLNVEEVVPL